MIKEINEFENYRITTEGTILLPNNKIKIATKNNKGYLRISLSKNGTKKTFSIHRLVALHFIPNPNNYSQVNHIDGVKINNSIENLEWVSCKDNIIKSFELGLSNYKGERCGRCKFPDSVINNIRSSFSQGKTRHEIALFYGISYSHIVSIINKGKRPC